VFLLHNFAGKATSAKPNSLPTLFLLVALAGFYFLYARPRSKKAKAQQAEARRFAVGDEVQTIGGLIGTLTKDDGATVTIRTVGGQELEFLRKAIAQRFNRPSDEPNVAISPEAPEAETGDQ
jgi:preprotein translocase subunit YajC